MPAEPTVLDGLQPRAFWAHFEALTRVPRPSRREGPVIEHVREWAAAARLGLKQDAGGNLVRADPDPAGASRHGVRA